MFETVPSAEVTPPWLYEATGAPTKVWSYVAHGLVVPWFHVDVTDGVGGRIVFATYLDQWLPLLQPARETVVSSVRLVSPFWLNGTDDWMMEPLVEVWRGTEPVGGGDAYVYVVKGARRYVHSECGTPESRIKGLRRVYLTRS